MKKKIAILNNRSSERLVIEFYLTRARVEGIFFDNEQEMENWLRHCIDDNAPVIAAIVDCAVPELSPQHFPCSDVLSKNGIPLIIAASSRDLGDWCNVSNPLIPGAKVYLSPLVLLPQLLVHISQTCNSPEQDHFNHLSNTLKR